MRYSEWEDQAADFEAEMAANEIDTHEQLGSEPRELFTSYDQHGWLDSEWQR